MAHPAPPLVVARADLAALLFIRHFETALLELFAQGRVAGTTHTCLGQEYIPVALAPLLAGDHVFSNHRGHGHYLARYDDPAGLLAEIMGRAGGVCGGVGGSQHLWRPDYLSTGVQGQSVPVAAGVALHLQQSGRGQLAAAFVGDGTFGEGAVYEGLNLAALWRLPLVLFVENNGIAQSTPTDRQLAGTIAGRAAAFGIAYAGVDTDDVGEIRSAVGPLLAAVRDGGGPLIVEFRTRRLGPHSKGDDSRTPAELAALRSADWYARTRALDPVTFDEIDERQRARMAAVLADVANREPAGQWAGTQWAAA
ncbi:thiamine pyrophosphate-dependent dehydrogenase E1 component subunit alpha [Hamadaea tsunoensis]|uniref:thiamine pyrophosphate-dependent dehydrogenase E1 component subunit alpha n=1 Tax=Hamadaea tsunoensis TaxID=53368 RepID=UPI000429ECB8|nr:thiamine pyrophosphate-dependent dehydrogenase E1 component subunit alpha [Hamadaea tsunoensis]